MTYEIPKNQSRFAGLSQQALHNWRLILKHPENPLESFHCQPILKSEKHKYPCLLIENNTKFLYHCFPFAGIIMMGHVLAHCWISFSSLSASGLLIENAPPVVCVVLQSIIIQIVQIYGPKPKSCLSSDVLSLSPYPSVKHHSFPCTVTFIRLHVAALSSSNVFPSLRPHQASTQGTIDPELHD